MNTKKIVIILAAFGILSLAAYLIIDAVLRGNTGVPPRETVEIFSFDAAAINEVTFTNPDGEFKFQNTDSGWTVGNSDFLFNSSYVNITVTNMAALTSEYVVAEQPDNLDVYGLSNPKLISCTDGNEVYTLEIGQANATMNGFYVKKHGEPAVYSISLQTGTLFDHTKKTLMDIYMFGEFSNDVKKIKLERGGKPVYDLNKTDNWSMETPLKTDRLNTANITNTVIGIINLNIIEFVADKLPTSEYSKYGLDKPSYILELAAASGRSEKLIFGKETSDGQIYALYDSRENLVTLPKNQMGFLDEEVTKYLLTNVHSENIYGVSSVDISLDGEKIKLETNVDEKKYADSKFYYNSKDVSGGDLQELFLNLYKALNNVEFSELDLNGVSQVEEPFIEIVYNLKNGDKTVVSYARKGDELYYALVNGEYTGYVVKLSTFYGDVGIFKSKQRLDIALGI
ncbi:MAG: DUF4340 domain-containing protein [Oscillospiraceae bacterium]|jgi:hypothetical protein|nr:DUF4340 domain-containing protein [Oscillospiraceae bacterium]